MMDNYGSPEAQKNFHLYSKLAVAKAMLDTSHPDNVEGRNALQTWINYWTAQLESLQAGTFKEKDWTGDTNDETQT